MSNILNLLLVCTGEGDRSLFSTMDFEGLDDMEYIFGNKLYNYIIKNDLYFYDDEDDADKEYPMVNLHNIPPKYMTDKVIEYYSLREREYHDIETNRYDIFNRLKQLYPGVTVINYCTLDMYIPNIYTVEDLYEIQEKNKHVGMKLGIFINFLGHNYTSFDDYLNKAYPIILPSKYPVYDAQLIKYNTIWFLGCTHPHYLIPNDLTNFINQLKNILEENGVIMYSDGWDVINGVQDKTSVWGFINCLNRIPDIDKSDKARVIKFLKYIEEINEGVYKFKS
jgi:hypothetical protein